MKTAEQVENEFRAELQALINKYGAEIEVRDHYQGYSECGEDIRMMVTIPTIYDSDGYVQQDYTEFNLGCWLSYE